MPSTLQVAAIHADAAVVDPAQFLVGQDREGYWVAIESHGRAGGLFRNCEAPVEYVKDETGHHPGAVLICEERVTLQI